MRSKLQDVKTCAHERKIERGMKKDEEVGKKRIRGITKDRS